jgi:mannose-6-phosphate isomerase-like protein (cupin superfamily)
MPDLIRNIAEVPWQRMPAHDAGALSKLLVHPETTGSRHLDYRISTYAPGAGVDRHAHRVQEQVYHVLEGEGLMEVGENVRVVRRHDVIQLPAGVPHRILNTGLGDLTFIVVTSPVTDDPPA